IPSQLLFIMPDSTNTQIEGSHVSRRKFLQGLVIAGASGGAGLALSQVLAPPVFAGSITDVEPASYIIYIDSGGTIYARNGTTGAVDYSGPDAATVLQNALGAASSGGTIFFREGTYNLSKG